MNDFNPLVSVILPTFNSSKTIEKCLMALNNQSYNKIEIIIVDNFSDDETEKIVFNLKKFFNFSLKFYKASLLRAAARNFGSNIAAGVFLLHLDSDMQVSKNLISECVSKIGQNLDALIIPETSICRGFWSKSHSLTKSLSLFMPGYEGIRFVRKKLFDLIGGFDLELTSGEDFDFYHRFKKISEKIGRTSNVIFHLEDDLTLNKILHNYIFYSKSLPKYFRKNKFSIQTRTPTFYVIFKKRNFLLKDPFHSTGWFFLLFLNFVIIRISLFFDSFSYILSKMKNILLCI